MKEKDLINFDVQDKDGIIIPVTAAISNGWLYVGCLSKQFFSAFGEHTTKFRLGVAHPFFQQDHGNAILQQLKKELIKLKFVSQFCAN